MDTSRQNGAHRKLAVPRPINEKQLSAFLKSRKGGNSFEKRLAETLRQAWCRIEELEGEPPKSTIQEERDWQTCERVLVVSEVDGVVEIFAEPWLAVKHVEVKPWEERDEVVSGLSDEWKRLDEAPKSKVLIVPQLRASPTQRQIVDLVLWKERITHLETLLKLRGK